ncbi:hypothetical protein [Kribbella sp. VKM Ac-2569]|nr:hypothetical protein [Kribbella sp. VKM Ac-2569]
MSASYVASPALVKVVASSDVMYCVALPTNWSYVSFAGVRV